jgi:hypothetical protein
MVFCSSFFWGEFIFHHDCQCELLLRFSFSPRKSQNVFIHGTQNSDNPTWNSHFSFPPFDPKNPPMGGKIILELVDFHNKVRFWFSFKKLIVFTE